MGSKGAVLKTKLKYLPAWNEARRKNARSYNQLLSGIDEITIPRQAEYAKHIYHIYAVRVKDRDRLMERLSQQGVSCGIHYPVPIHLQQAYQSLGLTKGSFPVAEKCAEQFLSLPMFPELTPRQIEYVVNQIEQALRGNHSETELLVG